MLLGAFLDLGVLEDLALWDHQIGSYPNSTACLTVLAMLSRGSGRKDVAGSAYLDAIYIYIYLGLKGLQGSSVWSLIHGSCGPQG